MKLLFIRTLPPLFAIFVLFTLELRSEPTTKVFLNGVVTPVYFNDGDSFRVLAGSLKGSKARIAGFNTLESYGPVHKWGAWDPKELYHYSYLGTLNARKGIWRCNSDMSKDTYGRTLWNCFDLARDQIKKGLAHVMLIGHYPDAEKLLALQTDAIKNRVGIWAKGTPDYILTSAHSSDEKPFGDMIYDRFVSVADGVSTKWFHRRDYDECQEVCATLPKFDRKMAAAFANSKFAANRDVSKKQIWQIVSKINKDRSNTKLAQVQNGLELGEQLLTFYAKSVGEKEIRVKGACLTYIDYRRRYGRNRASCLR